MTSKYFNLILILIFLNSCSKDISQEKYINEEPFIFKDEECKKIIVANKNISIKQVYSYSSDKTKQFYKEDKDYFFDLKNNEICRLNGSNIINFNDYLVDYRENSKKFEFKSEPRNPPRTIPYYTYVDYVYKDNATLIKSKKFLHNELKNKDLKVLIIGDSIFASADTNALYYKNDDVSDNFMMHIKRNFENLYANKLEVINLSRGGNVIGLC